MLMQKEEKKSILKRLIVVNKYKHEKTSDDEYIGRGSLFGNPYSHLPSKHSDVTLCADREEAIEAYREYFDDIMDSCGCKHKDLKHKIRQLIMKLRFGGEVNLVCFCTPKSCHGDIIRDYLLKELDYE